MTTKLSEFWNQLLFHSILFRGTGIKVKENLGKMELTNWLSVLVYSNVFVDTKNITEGKQSVVPLRFCLISVNKREKTVTGVGARTWPSLLVTIPVWLLLFCASYVHMCYTHLMYQQKEHLSVWGDRARGNSQSASQHCNSSSHWKCSRHDAYFPCHSVYQDAEWQ